MLTLFETDDEDDDTDNDKHNNDASNYTDDDPQVFM